VQDKSIDGTDAGLAGWNDAGARLRQAFERDEFALYCQPILALQGAERYPLGEVLVRMREEEKAMLPPGEFLPILEHYRMMPQLDRWVVRNLAKRLAVGSKLHCFSMNLSSQTLDDADFPKYVAGVVKAAGIAAGAVLFEIEEHELLARPDRVAGFVEAVRPCGAGVLIDGYGRKSVSFTPLKTSGAQYVKVDGSIVRKLLGSELARTRLNAILRVGKAMGVKVIAECVEEREVLDALKALEVDYAQGFGIVQPQPIDSFAK